jgi:sulfate transport system permease protein
MNIPFKKMLTGKNKVVKMKMPGFGLTLGLSLTYMTLLIFIPLSALVLYSVRMPVKEFWKIISDVRVLSAFKISFSSAFLPRLSIFSQVLLSRGY